MLQIDEFIYGKHYLKHTKQNVLRDVLRISVFRC